MHSQFACLRPSLSHRFLSLIALPSVRSLRHALSYQTIARHFAQLRGLCDFPRYVILLLVSLHLVACSSHSPNAQINGLTAEPQTFAEPTQLVNKLGESESAADMTVGLQESAVIPEEEIAFPGLNEEAAGYTIDAVNLPLQVLLYSLAEKAELELTLDAELSQVVTLRVVDKPLEHILGMLANQSGIRWELNENVLDIASIEPYLKSYPVDYLNMSRSATSRVGLATQVGSINLAADAAGGSSGFSNSSQSVIENESKHQFWESLSENIGLILSINEKASADFVINRDAGIVSVRGSAQQHREIDGFLHSIQEIAQRQVLIEATVVEVALSDQYQAGIDWRLLASDDSSISAAQVFHAQGLPGGTNGNKLPAPTSLLTAIHQSNSLGKITATLQLLEGFGDVRILSRPQIIAINNQSAILKVVDNRVYFTMSVERATQEGEDDVTTSTQIHTVPVGLVMNVTPYIGADNTVILNVRPTISRILGFVNDPNPELAAAQVQNGVPEIQVREMESVLKVPNGEIAMIGGLMQQQRNSQTQSVPFLGDLPGVGRMFQHKSRRGRKTELLVFLQPTVLNLPGGG